MRRDVVIRKNCFDTAGLTHAMITILHVNLVGQGDAIAKLGQEFLVRMRCIYRFAERRAIGSYAIEDDPQPFEWFVRQNAFEVLLSRFEIDMS